ncbi:Mandelate racemase/muconate lactonizing protein [Halothece sp. PCC 7418]|uniref:dipeptide epimerase n=1 Tax=Halothece sp. (strain PCC 7418) TaxID=65093 RepID=UPI0002A072FA|nr:dipeptide epimerase [Halothece sp. PCC 7418]AFZ44884.1 Mandelate racemase/muconate lactonizing protein [Halothece sp. PCC 7418]
MKLTAEPFTVQKRFPLTISRGTTSTTTNLWVKIEAEGIEGWGEAVPFSIGGGVRQTTADLQQQLQAVIPLLQEMTPLARSRIQSQLKTAKISSAIRSAIDVACYDWLGKRTGLPVWQILGLAPDSVPISVTVGISSPKDGKKRLENWQSITGGKRIKVKLGSPEGLDADQRLFQTLYDNAPHAKFTIDANGGWRLEQAITMSYWLANYNVDYIEQPLPVTADEKLPLLAKESPLPIFADESCFTSEDIPRLAELKVQGINIKLMKAGSLTEVLKMVYTAQACGLQVMYGCYSDSAIANTAMAHLGSLADYLDLDSHLNLKDDPFEGAVLNNGYLQPNTSPGLGLTYHAANTRPSSGDFTP